MGWYQQPSRVSRIKARRQHFADYRVTRFSRPVLTTEFNMVFAPVGLYEVAPRGLILTSRLS